MSEILDELKYTESHEWLLLETDGTVTVGVTDQAQSLLGDLVFVELPEVGEHKDAGEECAVVESVKAASDVYTPISGEIIAVNDDLEETPGQVNQSPYGDGWLFKLKPDAANEIDSLLDSDAYREHLAEQE